MSTHIGLQEMTPEVRRTMTAHLYDLVYGPPLREIVAHVERQGALVRLTIRTDSSLTAVQVAETLEHPSLRSKWVEGNDVVLSLVDETAAVSMLQGEDWACGGPFVVHSYTPDTAMTLERRSGERPRFIDVISIPSEDEEWRRFMAGGIDVMPHAFPSARRQLSDLASARVVPVENPLTAAIWFKPGDGPGAREQRHRLAAALHRKALARAVNGEESSAAQFPEHRAALPAAETVDLIVDEAIPDLVRAASSVQQQLALVDINVRIHALEEPEVYARLMSGDFDLFLMHGDYTLRYAEQLIAFPPWAPYRTPELEAAVAAKDEAAVARILERDLPFTMLFKLDEVVVVRSTLCNVHPIVSHDLSWLADVRWCKPGEVE